MDDSFQSAMVAIAFSLWVGGEGTQNICTCTEVLDTVFFVQGVLGRELPPPPLNCHFSPNNNINANKNIFKSETLLSTLDAKVHSPQK